MEEGKLPPCERFTIVASRPSERLVRCDVCDQTEDAHPVPGRRTLSGGEVEAIRRRMLIETFDQREEDRRHRDSNGANAGSNQ